MIDDKEKLLKIIGEIVKRMLSKESIEKIMLEIDIKNNIYVIFEGVRMGRVPSDRFDKNKVEKLLLDLINSEDFQNRLGKIKEKLMEVYDYFDLFSDGVEKIISDNKLGRELKGRCNDCPSFWKL